jgi:hypothetical protein
LHGELVRLRPGPRHLTAFYLIVAVGGALGGVFVALVAPAVFAGYWEYQLTLVLTSLLVLAARTLDLRRHRPRSGPRLRWAGDQRVLTAAGGAAVAGIALLAVVLVRDIEDSNQGLLTRERNFYGSVRVFEFNTQSPDQAMVVMEHGRILHGFQFTAPEKRGVPGAYYGPNSGAGIALRDYPRQSPLSVGVIGLGAGMLAAYAQPDEQWQFYEINPMVTRLADQYFTFLKDARERGADLDVRVGDGRSVLQRQLDQGEARRFDVLVLDAFSSDAIPVHLLTREAFELYWRALKPDGVLAINISNRHVDLSPVVRKLAEVNGKEAHWVSGQAGDGEGVLASVWVLVTSNRTFLDAPDVAAHLQPWPENAPKPRLWTDDFSNVYSLMRLY